MNLASPSDICGMVQDMLVSQRIVMGNRALINRLFNGEPPKTEEERKRENLKTNANWLEATRIAHNATNQLNNAFSKGAIYFTVRLDKGPVAKRATYAASITKHINKLLKRHRYYKSASESANAQVILHGPGPLLFKNKRCPVPCAAGVDDVILPAGTYASMENLDRFGIYREWTWNQLYDMTHGPAVDPGWNNQYVDAVLYSLYKKGTQPIYQGNRWMFPEKIQEDLKEGAAFSANSSLPKMLAWDFFYRMEDNGKWCRKLILDYDSIGGEFKNTNIDRNRDFLYQNDSYADNWDEIIQWRIGNCSNVAPYKYYSIRSCGYLLYGVCLIQNQMRNRLYDHIFQSLLTLFRNVSDDSREKLQMVDLQNFGILPDGVNMVSANERHSVDWELVLMGLNQGRQLMAETAQTFVPDSGGSSQRELTATEALIRKNTSITLASAVLNQLAEQSVFEFREIGRRFCLKGNTDPLAKEFRENVKSDGVPAEMLDIEAWDIIPEVAPGGGDKAAELMVTQGLMQEIFPLADPSGQRIIARRRYLALTDNPDEAMEVFPDAPTPMSDDAQYAQGAFAVLMLGMPFVSKEGVNHVAYVGMLMQMMQFKMQQTQQVIGTPTGLSIAAESIAGLLNVAQHCQEHIQMIAQDERRRDLANQLMKALEQMVKAIQDMGKAVMEQSQQQAGAQGGVSPETQQKLAEKMLLAQAEADAKRAKSQHGQELKEAAYLSENERRNAMAASDVQRKLAMTQADIVAKDLTTAAEIRRESAQPVGKE